MRRRQGRGLAGGVCVGSRKVLLSVLRARSGFEAKEDWPAMSADPHYLARTTTGLQHCPHLVNSRDRSTAV